MARQDISGSDTNLLRQAAETDYRLGADTDPAGLQSAREKDGKVMMYITLVALVLVTAGLVL